MKFHEKLRRCGAEVNKSKAGAAAGLGPNTISSYIAKGSIPRADIALKIARALGVPLEWLLDDDQDWPPPPKAGASAADLTDAELMHEAARRYRLAAARQNDNLKLAASIDWRAAALKMLQTPPGQPLPPDVEHAKLLCDTIRVDSIRLSFTYNPELLAEAQHDSMPGRNRPVTDFSHASLSSRVSELWDQVPGFNVFTNEISDPAKRAAKIRELQTPRKSPSKAR